MFNYQFPYFPVFADHCILFFRLFWCCPFPYVLLLQHLSFLWLKVALNSSSDYLVVVSYEEFAQYLLVHLKFPFFISQKYISISIWVFLKEGVHYIIFILQKNFDHFSPSPNSFPITIRTHTNLCFIFVMPTLLS